MARSLPYLQTFRKPPFPESTVFSLVLRGRVQEEMADVGEPFSQGQARWVLSGPVVRVLCGVFHVPTHSYQAWAVRPAEAKGSDYIWAVTLPKTDFLSPAGQDWS